MRERACQHLALLDEAGQLHVGARDIDGERHAGRLCIRGTRALGADRRIELGTVAAEEVELPGAGGLDVRRLLPAAGDGRRDEAMFGVALARGVERAVHLRTALRLGRGNAGLGTAAARLGHAQARAAGDRPLDQLAELRVREGTPPAGLDARGRCGRRGRRGGSRLAEGAGLEQRSPGLDAAGVGAAGEQQEQRRTDSDGDGRERAAPFPRADEAEGPAKLRAAAGAHRAALRTGAATAARGRVVRPGRADGAAAAAASGSRWASAFASMRSSMPFSDSHSAREKPERV